MALVGAKFVLPAGRSLGLYIYSFFVADFTPFDIDSLGVGVVCLFFSMGLVFFFVLLWKVYTYTRAKRVYSRLVGRSGGWVWGTESRWLAS